PASVDVQIAITRGGDLEVIATTELAKDDAPGAQIYSRLHPIDIGTDADGDPIGSLVVLPADKVSVKPSAVRSKRMLKATKIGLRAMTNVVAEIGQPAPASNHIPTTAKVVKLDDWRRNAYQSGISSGEERARQIAFERAKDWLVAEGLVGMWGDYFWLIDLWKNLWKNYAASMSLRFASHYYSTTRLITRLVRHGPFAYTLGHLCGRLCHRVWRPRQNV